MHNISHIVIIILLLLTITGYSRFSPSKDKEHSGRALYSGRWGRWCTEDFECGHGFCQAYICQCYRGYITWSFMDVCKYEQRTKIAAFLVSFFFGTFGVDWFVLSRGQAGYIIAGIIKMVISFGCIFGWPAIIVGVSKKNANIILLAQVINVTLSVTSFIWWLTDWIRILADVFYDGYGAPLQSWRYNYGDRISYSV
ncbi:unnamed protein product [Rotaria magnacalcarata]|uniref:Uncharacterized protein n=1 Tax=Rotaria magnacalcarata TaxID=392030 RepID=A0A816B4Q5_9BILA|nr:unnamed protein product [Rotaria magnacalcarata]CAF1606660.1 unnamed protein product [Rotaria magnacalcarata]CAF2087152.1 unnamed protein product [Rotaria magnacalcarata]CAF2213285.1 unnamed protein product [Rotaria magnacalcarata]CAF2214735.1 unnamed protein product [Rotaria magnacalcarata]